MLAAAVDAARAEAVMPFRLPADDVSPVIATFVRSWHDAIHPDERLGLYRMSDRLLGTHGPLDLEEQRALATADWLVRWYAPSWLVHAGVSGPAMSLSGLPELKLSDLEAVLPMLRSAADEASAAWVSARTTAKERIPAASWHQTREDVRHSIVREMIRTGEAAVRVPIETLEWAKAEFLIWEAVAACWWAIAWRGVLTMPAASVNARVTASLIPMRDRLKLQAADVLDRMLTIGADSEQRIAA